MKKILKSKIFIVIITTIMVASGTLYAANIYYANEVKYTPSDSSWNVKNVNDALNNLYSMKTELDTIKGIGDATAGDIASGKTAVVKGEKVTGTKVDGTNYKVYKFNNVEATASDDYHSAYKDAAWVPITYVKNYDCSDGYCFQEGGVDFTIDVGFTPKKIIGGNVCLSVKSATKESNYNIRLSRGFAKNSGNEQYWYMPYLCTSEINRNMYIDTNGTDNTGFFGYNRFYIKNNKLYFNSWYDINTTATGDMRSGEANSGYKVYGTLFYLSGTIIYEE